MNQYLGYTIILNDIINNNDNSNDEIDNNNNVKIFRGIRAESININKLSKVSKTNAYDAILQRKICGILNRITPEKFDNLKEKIFNEINERVDCQSKFELVLDAILDNASTESLFAEQYAYLCVFLFEQKSIIIRALKNEKTHKK